jgi:protein-arginine kinase activator protein McsA
MWTVLDIWAAIVEARLTALRKAMRIAVQQEQYLKAARLRDQIRSIERQRGEREPVAPARHI